MALEAGGAMHDVFAALRLWAVANVQQLPDHARHHERRVLSHIPAKSLPPVVLPKRADPHDHALEYCFAVLHNSGFYDDPRDNIRTITNMESSILVYVREMDAYHERYPIFIADPSDPTALIGVELTGDVTLIFSDGRHVRYIGTMDALMTHARSGALVLGENKTASRLDEAWRQSFEISHQVTGYCAMGSALLDRPIFKSKIFGLKIKPTNYNDDFVPIDPIDRDEAKIRAWSRWVYRQSLAYETYADDYESADMYTHSCNRYFRPCSLIPFCSDTEAGRAAQWDTMAPRDLSPSEINAGYKV